MLLPPLKKLEKKRIFFNNLFIKLPEAEREISPMEKGIEISPDPSKDSFSAAVGTPRVRKPTFLFFLGKENP